MLEDWGCCHGAMGKPCGPPAGKKVFRSSHHHRSSHACKASGNVSAAPAWQSSCSSPSFGPRSLHHAVAAIAPSAPKGEESAWGVLTKQACATGTQVRDEGAGGAWGWEEKLEGWVFSWRTVEWREKYHFLLLIIKASLCRGVTS